MDKSAQKAVKKQETLFHSGHTACAGCGQAIGARLVIDTAGPNTIATSATGCLEVFSTKYPESSWGIPWIHSLFENSAAVASGVEAALRHLGTIDKIRVIAQGGDGGTADIGLQALSGMMERGQDVLYVCYDNEAYMNCLSLSSLIMAKDGLKKITDINVGDEIYAFDQKTHDLVLKKCTGVFDNGVKEVFELETLHHTIKATGNHPFLVLKRNGRGNENDFVWKRLDKLSLGDEVVTLKRVKSEKSCEFAFKKTEKEAYKVNKLNPMNIPGASSPELMKYLGLYVGDGWVRESRGEVGFAIPQNTKAREDLLTLHAQLFGNHLRHDKNYVYINSVNLARFINSLGFKKGAKNKTVPSWVFTVPKEEKEAFLEGLMLSDGYKVNGSKSCRYVSSSEDLLKRLRLLLQTIGLRVGKIHRQKKLKGQKCVYRALLHDAEYGYICFSKKRRWNVKKYPNQYKYQNFLIENEYFETEKIRSIRSVGHEPTLDLRVEGEHNFIADGMVVHNTGIQRSGLTPFDSNTTTSPPGKISSGNPLPKKNMVEICAAHRIPYAATSTVGFPTDVQRKVKKALSIRGPKYLHIHVPCPLGWRHPSNITINIAKLAVETGLYPLVEYEYGKLASARKLTTLKPVEEYLKPQGRFAHLFKDEKGKRELAKIQQIANQNIKYYNLK